MIELTYIEIGDENMQIFKKMTASVMAAGIALAGTSAAPPGKSEAASVISLSPENRYEINNGVFEGWGTSLCWWANRLGYSDTLAQKAADVFYGTDGLHLNIARFNIGGGDDPTHDHITRTDSNMPGYTVYNNGTVTYNWDADYNQRNVLLRSIKACGDDMIVEMFSNSPPYYMTNSGCTSGAADSNKNNLKDDQYTAFAEYMAEVCAHYKDVWGVDIQSVEPMNEPYTNYWGAYSTKQEGCHFDQGDSESKILVEMKKAMDKKGMSDVIICGTDETSIDTQISSYNKLSDEAKNTISRIDTHTYSGSKRSELKETALTAGKNLWMSEVDGGGTAGVDAGEMGSGLWLADRILADCNGLNCSAWILWQAIDSHISSTGYNGKKDTGMVNTSGGFWGVAVADHDKNEIVLTKKYYSFGQFTRYIRPGMTMLKTSGSTMAAYDEKNGQLAIVVVNDTGSAADYTFDLSGFSSVGETAQGIRTSATENWKDIGNTALKGTDLSVTIPANSITTYIVNDVKGSTSLENKIEVTNDMLTGTDSWKNSSSTNYEKVFDGSMSTYFDGLTAGWVQADLGKIYDITAIGYCPRSGYEYRMADGMFMFSEDGVNWETVSTITGKPSFGMHYITRLSGNTSARYIKYAVPEGAPTNDYNTDSTYCCNIAEIELYGLPSFKNDLENLTPVEISGSGSWKDQQSVNYEKAFDGDTSTYFDGLSAGWVQADLGGLYDIQAVGVCARKGYEYRVPDAQIQVSKDGENWTTVYTIEKKPEFGLRYYTGFDGDTTARYVRYQVPEGTPTNIWNTDSSYCCNIAEFEIYGKSASVEGDLDSDGKVGSTDLVLMQSYLLKLRTLDESQFILADLNKDGSTDVFDMIILRKLAVA